MKDLLLMIYDGLQDTIMRLWRSWDRHGVYGNLQWLSPLVSDEHCHLNLCNIIM